MHPPRHPVAAKRLPILPRDCAVCLVAATCFLLPHELDASKGGPAVACITHPLLGLGIVASCALMAEGSIGDWGALSLRQTVGASPPVASPGYAAFTPTMTAGRLLGDRATAWLGPVRLVRLGGALVAAGAGPRSADCTPRSPASSPGGRPKSRWCCVRVGASC